MRKHRGAHARNSAMDVVPFVPVANVTMAECVALANEFGRRMADELGLPCYLYEEACVKGDFRRSLKQLRGDGEYEGLPAKLKDPKWAPDYGSAEFNPAWGVTATGARPILIAYNINVLGTKEQAHRFALDIRTDGRGPQQPGKFKAVKAVGWFIEDYQTAQVSINLDNYKITAPHEVFEEVSRLGKQTGIGSASLVPR